MGKEQKISFFKRMLIAIKDFEKYGELAAERKSKVVAYFFGLTICFAVILAIAILIKMGITVHAGVNYIENEVEGFSYQNGQMQVVAKETPIQMENEKEILQCIIVDTDEISKEKIDTYRSRVEKYENGIVLLKDKVLLKTSMLANAQEETYETLNSSYGLTSINSKEELLNLLTGPIIYTMAIALFITFVIYLFVIEVFTFAIDAILFALLANITAMISRFRMRFSAAYSIAIYAGTLPLLLNSIYIIVRQFTGFTIQYFGVMYYSIWLIYIVTVVLMIKTDLMKQQQELAKLVEEQQRVKMELETEKRREERKKQKEEKDKEDKKTDDKKKKGKKKKEQMPEPEAEMIQEKKDSTSGENSEA